MLSRVDLTLDCTELHDPAGIAPRLCLPARLRAAGAGILSTFEGHHVVMADPEGHEFCVA